jgi:serine/threonine protein kinase
MISPWFSYQASSLIKSILRVDLNKRIKFHQISDHPWFKEVLPLQVEGITVGTDPIPVINEYT